MEQEGIKDAGKRKDEKKLLEMRPCGTAAVCDWLGGRCGRNRPYVFQDARGK